MTTPEGDRRAGPTDSRSQSPSRTAVGAQSYGLVSVIVPAYRQADHIADILTGYHDALGKLSVPHEMVVVVNGPADGTLEACRAVQDQLSSIRVVESRPGWGRAVQHGLHAARGDLLCYTNSARTSPEDLVLILLYALAYPGVVIKANRRTRDNWRRRLGSLVYNLECRQLFDLANFDVNGTPKAFARDQHQLLTLHRDDDLVDLEFNAVCHRFGYPMVEVPVVSTRRHGGSSTTNYRSALRMYWGAYSLWRELQAVGPGRASSRSG